MPRKGFFEEVVTEVKPIFFYMILFSLIFHLNNLHRRGFVLAISFLLFVSVASAQRVYSEVEQIPNVQLLDSTRFVSDPENMIPDAQETQLNRQLHQLRLQHGVEAVVVLLPSIGVRNDVESFALSILRQWGLGDKKRNTGLVILAVLDIRAIRIEVGYGLEGIITDAVASRIIAQDIAPLFAEQNYGGGLLQGVQAIADRVVREDLPGGGVSQGSQPKLRLDRIILFYIGLMILFGGIIIFRAYKNIFPNKRGVGKGSAAYRLRKIEEFSPSGVFMCILFLPMGLLILVLLFLWRKRIKAQIGVCPSCGNPTFQNITGITLAEKLSPLQKKEQELGSKTFELLRCSTCSHQESYSYVVPDTPYERCPKCKGMTLVKTRTENVSRSFGQVTRIYKHCMYCDHHERIEKRNNDDILLSTLLLGGGSFSGLRGGGFGGGGFGGGSGGGGGATGRF